MTDDASLQPLLAHNFLALADLLDSISDAQWETSSLCEGWRIREVIAHLTMPVRYSEQAFMAELRDCDFDFTRLSNQIAARDATLATTELVANLRTDVMHHWTPPGGGYHGALNHVVIHGLDVTVPLRVPRRSSDEAMIVVLDGLTDGGGHSHFGVEIDGRSLQATDIDWSWGAGSSLCGTADDLALALCGRSLPYAHLEGKPL
ncbi:maleylpyruvate isomerase family mycothiol-dependent enzyme [Streptomyces sp. NPDC001984]|uniref:maleylpyruvate isomerase family mycothiol-dependent enzyme n=1 Tax=Streptomyces sp. NPDC002619 TaxID=3364655 RepID=UPI003691F17B